MNQPLTTSLYTYKAQVLRVIDGDTLELLVDLGFKAHKHLRARLAFIDTPEVYGVKHSSDEYQRGKAASLFTAEWIKKNAEIVKKTDISGEPAVYYNVFIRSKDGDPQDKYGRWVVEVFPGSGTENSLNTALVTSGHAEETNY